jgi:Uma2 family endonuclease
MEKVMVTWLDDDPERLLYPESDGRPIADDTRQFAWIVKLQGNLDALFRDDPNVFVAADLFWYPVQGEPTVRAVPDTMVVFGRPKGHRHSYRQWREVGVAPQVVFEVQSPHDLAPDIDRKFEFYDQHGVEEYYHYDPQRAALFGWHRFQGRLRALSAMRDWISPRLDVRFDLFANELEIYRSDGQRFRTFVEQVEWSRTPINLGELDSLAMQEADRRTSLVSRRIARYEGQLRALGIEPEA